VEFRGERDETKKGGTDQGGGGVGDKKKDRQNLKHLGRKRKFLGKEKKGKKGQREERKIECQEEFALRLALTIYSNEKISLKKKN